MSVTPITTAVQEITIDSNRILHHTEADLIDRRIPKVIRLVQYDDTLPVIAVDLKAGGVNYTLPAGAACNIRIRKPDDTIVYNPALGCDLTRSVVYFEVTPQMGGVVGELQTVLEVILNGTTAGTSPLRIVVENNPIKVDDYESMDEVQTIIQLVGEAEDARDEAVAAAETAAQDAVREIAAETFKSIASYEATTTASKPYSIGDYLGYDGKLYKVTALIAQGGTIVTSGANANVEQTTAGDQISDVQGDVSDIQDDVSGIQSDVSDVQDDISSLETAIANKVLRFDSVAVSATTGDIATVSDSRITAEHVVVECVWGNSSYITTDVTATTTAGTLTLNGTSTAATTATVTLVKKDN